MRKSSLVFEILLNLWEAWDRMTYSYRHPYSVLTTMPEYHEEKRRRYFDGLHRLVGDGYLSKGKGQTYALTDKTKKLLGVYELEEFIVLKQKKKWDNKWRFVIFDVPEKHRKKRDKLREILQRLKFKRIQKSVWFTPHDVLREVRDLASHHRLEKYIILIESFRINTHHVLEKKFFSHIK